MELTCRGIGAVRVVAAQGRIDHASAADFQQTLAPHLALCSTEGSPLVIDFGGVEYISSIGLRVLMLAAKQVKAQNGRIAMAALTPLVAEVFQISRFNLVFKVFATAEAAATELSQ